jgi:hypothetical protein
MLDYAVAARFAAASESGTKIGWAPAQSVLLTIGGTTELPV